MVDNLFSESLITAYAEGRFRRGQGCRKKQMFVGYARERCIRKNRPKFYELEYHGASILPMMDLKEAVSKGTA
jgi:hypothetical protein